MRALLSTIGASIGALGNLTLLLAIVIYTFAVIGMQLFSESFAPDRFHDNEVPRWNFSDFLHSFMIIFRVLCGEWIEVLILTMHVASPAAALFYFAVLFLGNFLVSRPFLVIHSIFSTIIVDRMVGTRYQRLAVADSSPSFQCCMQLERLGLNI